MLKRRLRARVTRRRKKGGTKVVQTQFGRFDSGEEAERYQVLMTWEDEGRIANLRRGERLELHPAFVDMHGRRWTWHYTSDYIYDVPEYGIEVVEDFKSKQRPPEWKNKELMFRARYPTVHFFVNDRLDGWYVPPEAQP